MAPKRLWGAGKSTLLNALCGTKEVYADDLLFATLDPTTRRVDLPGGKEVRVNHRTEQPVVNATWKIHRISVLGSF